MKPLKTLLLSLIFPATAFALGAPKPAEWILTDLTTIPELSMFFGNSDAIITLKPDTQSDAVRPTVLVSKLLDSPDEKLKTNADWLALLKPTIKDPKHVVLKQDLLSDGRYILEFVSRNKDSKTDLHSLYLASQNADRSVTLFVYDGLGSATSRNLPLVRALFTDLDQSRLLEMYRDDVQRREALKRTQVR